MKSEKMALDKLSKHAVITKYDTKYIKKNSCLQVADNNI